MADKAPKDGASAKKDEPGTSAQDPPPGSGLSRKERQQVREGVRHRPAVVYEIIRVQGEIELRRPSSALWWSGVAAGISIGFSFLTDAVLAAHLPASEWSPLIAKLGYAVGFLIVILGHQQLFTENVLTAVLPVMARKQVHWLLKMLRLWGIVLAANIAGCLIFASALAYLPVVPSNVTPALADIVTKVMSNTPWEMFAKGIGAGWLIAALVWILSSTEHVEFIVITLLTYLIALFGFTHIVAGSVEAIYGVATGIISLETAVFRFFLPTLAGNVFGGTILFSVLSYAQVREEIYADTSES
ncbi:formate/nitrite transporter [Hyphomicrobium denitrificans ATCC 51888]|uniref:Formate/nitrite transporter n=1 Tax=Hyphomicrobium denitrificans (strain ATCC 51888 / DSM 1869 / NCIMB 11706 / TK 0415) TaxID=582899 RepID=D8JRA5_HYPDA|nr:formate/nitrite transporter family protein [Hyphomicrobium denitrificans]ADJ24090.1 formate/nitrite transporter [Hyphomicrobium denitrificans ATCC 51888]